MKKVLVILSFLVTFTVFAIVVLNSGGNSNTLYLLNWGEYINIDVVEKFEKEYNCVVIEETVTSSETMYQKIKAGTTSYDIAIPGDYMVSKMYNEGLLKPLDTSNSKLDIIYKRFNDNENIFNDDLENIINKNMNNYKNYFMPYFWGAYSIIYNTQNSKTESVVLNNGFSALFDKTLYDFDVKTGMYSTARWALAAYLMSKGLDPNLENLDINQISDEIKKADFDVWGDDQLKRKTAIGDLDMCFTQLGDFFDALYLSLDEGKGESINGKSVLESIEFNVNIPKITAAFFDAMVIPKTSKNEDLANKFINFMLESENAFENALAIGYCPTLKSVANLYQTSSEYYYEDSANPNRNITLKEFIEFYPEYLNPLLGSDTVFMFEPKEADYMTMCEKIVNQAKSNVKSNKNLGRIICYGVLGVVGISFITYVSLIIIKKRRKNELSK